LEQFVGKFKCLTGNPGVTGYFSVSNREKAKNQGNGVKTSKRQNKPTNSRVTDPAIQRSTDPPIH
jgi:hypothetical protein